MVSLFTSKHCVEQGQFCCVWSVLCGGGGRGPSGGIGWFYCLWWGGKGGSCEGVKNGIWEDSVVVIEVILVLGFCVYVEFF